MFPGVSTVADTNRTYPLGQTGVQMLGYVGQISSAQLQAQQVGRATNSATSSARAGSRTSTRPSCGDARAWTRSRWTRTARWWGAWERPRPRAGDDVVTNIDAGLEQTLQQALDAEIASLKGKSTEGAAVALDPQTGAVLALVSSPTYDPTWWTNGISTAHFHQIQATGAQNNNAIQGLYTPGSTFKLATATAALADRPHLARATPTTTPAPTPSRGARRAGSGAPPITTTRARSAAGSTCPRPSRCRATSSSTTSACSSGTTGRPTAATARPPSRTRPPSSATETSPASTFPTRPTSPGSTRPAWCNASTPRTPRTTPTASGSRATTSSSPSARAAR